MSTLVFIAAEAREFAGLLPRCGGARRVDWELQFAATGQLGGREVALVAHGPGPKLASAAALAACRHLKPAALISTGLCGALDPELQTGDMFVATAVRGSDGLSWAAEAPETTRPCRRGVAFSLDHVVQSAAEKRRLHAAGGEVVEMEAVGVAACARERGLPFYCVRAVLDHAGESFSLDFNRVRTRDGRFSRGRILSATLVRPWRLGELIGLSRRSRWVSCRLGDFLADCRF